MTEIITPLKLTIVLTAVLLINVVHSLPLVVVIQMAEMFLERMELFLDTILQVFIIHTPILAQEVM